MRTIKTFGFENIQAELTKISKSIPGATEKFLKQQAQYFKGTVKKVTPKDTGTMQNSWQTTGVKGSMKGLYIKVYNNTSYAPHVNYGHRLKRGGKVVGFVKGRFFLERALKNFKAKQLEIGTKIIKNIIKGMQ